jgi:hypothetical protein
MAENVRLQLRMTIFERRSDASQVSGYGEICRIGENGSDTVFCLAEAA